MSNFLPSLLSNLVYAVPSLLIAIVGLVISIRGLANSGRVAAPAAAGFSVLLAQPIISSIARAWLTNQVAVPGQRSIPAVATSYSFLVLTSSAIHLIGFGLLVLAIYRATTFEHPNVGA